MVKRQSLSVFLVLGAFSFLIVTSLFFTSSIAALPQGSTPAPKLPTPQEGSEAVATRQAPEVSHDSKRAGAPPTLKDLYAKYPMLDAYLDKLDEIDDLEKNLDFNEFYRVIALIYKDFGAAGVGLFLEESGLDYDLGVPLPYFDLLVVYEDGGFDKVFAQAKDWKFINDKNELIGYVVIDPLEKLDSVKAALKKMGVSTYDFDEDEWILDIGIPVQTLRNMKTPDIVLKFLTTIGYLDGVDEFFAPEPEIASGSSK
jgi:hypothetical protein